MASIATSAGAQKLKAVTPETQSSEKFTKYEIVQRLKGFEIVAGPGDSRCAAENQDDG